MTRIGIKESVIFMALVILAASGCRDTKHAYNHFSDQVSPASSSKIKSLLSDAKLTQVKQALPRVAYPSLQSLLHDPNTLWYDHTVMSRSYQDSYGAQINRNWPNQIASIAQDAANTLYDKTKRRWRFPFSTTAGTDHSDNITVINFLHLPEVNGQTLSIPVWQTPSNAGRMSWNWMYPNGTVLGEVIFISHGNQILPSEIRTRTRHTNGWASNVYRPFASAEQLAAAIQKRRPNWQDSPNLQKIIAHLQDKTTLRPKTLTGEGGFRSRFQQVGAIDELPDFQDPLLVKELLTQTTFVSTYGEVWKANGNLKTFAPSTRSRLSIVPINYDAGIIEVNDASCMRCHQDAGRPVSDFANALYLYGELWGKDNIFTFHIFDESQFRFNRHVGRGDTRRKNPQLVDMGILEDFNRNKHKPPHYRPRD